MHQVSMNIEGLQTCQSRLHQLAIDDIPVGTEINTPEGFGRHVTQHLSVLTGCPFIDAPNKFEELNTYNTMMELSGALNTLAVSLMKIVNDIRLLGSKPRCGIGELVSSKNEAGSSIMSGQVNLTQYEAMNAVAAQVMSNHIALTVCVSTGHFQLNVFKPLIIKNILHSIRVLSDVCYSFADHLTVGIKLIKHGQPEKSISNSSPSSANEKVFGNVGGARLTATTTTQMDYNKYNMEGEELIIARHLNSACQPDDPSSYNDVSMTPLRHSTLTSSSNLDQVSSGQQQQPSFVSTTPARNSQGITQRSISTTPTRHSQEIKRRSTSASPSRLINNNLSSRSTMSNNNSIKDKSLDINDEPNIMESPLISIPGRTIRSVCGRIRS